MKTYALRSIVVCCFALSAAADTGKLLRYSFGESLSSARQQGTTPSFSFSNTNSWGTCSGTLSVTPPPDLQIEGYTSNGSAIVNPAVTLTAQLTVTCNFVQSLFEPFQVSRTLNFTGIGGATNCAFPTDVTTHTFGSYPFTKTASCPISIMTTETSPEGDLLARAYVGGSVERSTNLFMVLPHVFFYYKIEKGVDADPGVISSSPQRVETIRLTGSDFVTGSQVSFGDGINVVQTTVRSSTAIDAEIVIDTPPAEGPRDITITKPDGSKSITKDKFYVSSIRVLPEVNQGAVMECTAAAPCIAGHDTFLRARLTCQGTGCQNNKRSVTGRLFVMRNGAQVGAGIEALGFTPGTPGRMEILAPGQTHRANIRGRGLDALNFRLTDRPEAGDYEFVVEVDPKNPGTMPTGPLDARKRLVHRMKGQVFASSLAEIHVGVYVEGNAPADVARAIEAFDYVRASWPIAAANLTARHVVSTMSYRPLGCVNEACTFQMFEDLRQTMRAGGSRVTHLALFTRNSAFTSDGGRGASYCTDGSGPTAPLHCPGKVMILNLDDASLPAVLAHELGHNFGFGDTYVADDPAGHVRSGLNPVTSECATRQNGCPVKEGYMDLLTREVSAFDASTPGFVGALKLDIMGNASRNSRWTDEVMWKNLLPRLRNAAGGLGQVSLAAGDSGIGESLPLQVPAVSAYLAVSGLINQSDVVTRLSISRAAADSAAPAPSPATHSVVVVDANGGTLATAPFNLSFQRMHRTTIDTEAAFSVVLTYTGTAKRVIVKKGDVEIASRTISTSAPTVAFTAPAGGTVTGTFNVAWSASDADGDPLGYTLLYSRQGSDWNAIASGLTSTTYAWDTSIVAGSTAMRLMVVANDGANETSATSATFTVPPKPPTVLFGSPFNGAAFAAGSTIELIGRAFETDGTELPGSALSYSSDRAGALGSGNSVSVSNLQSGTHTITLSAATASGTITKAIQLTIYSPAGTLRVLPVVGSAAGAGGSFFKTALQLHNPATTAIAGRIVYHPAGESGSLADLTLPYLLAPGATQYFDDLLPAMGTSGLGSADVFADYGNPPASLARIYNDGGASGTSGLSADLLRAEDALKAGDTAVLIGPQDPSKSRFNIGLRTLGDGATMTVTLKSFSGAVRTTIERSFGPTFFQQVSADNFLGLSLSAANSVSVTVTSGSVIVYGASTDNLTQDPSVQIARPQSRYADTASRILPVVGSSPGSGGSFFRTALSLHNGGPANSIGKIVYHPAGRSGTDTDPSVSYSLTPGFTQVFPDVVQSLTQSGLGSIDIVPSSGSAPVTVARIFNDGGDKGTSGMTQEQMIAAEAIAAGESGVLIIPPDLIKARINIGVRSLGAGASMTVTLRDAAGTVIHQRPLFYGANYFEQVSAAAFLGVQPVANGSISIRVEGGSAIVYSAITDNITQDPTMQVARPIR